jgi:predicted MFS family arabinose efflux permease
MRVRGVFVDTAPLRLPLFRRLWLGYIVSQTGSQLTVVAVAYQVFLLTHSSLDVGLVSLAQVGPAIVGPVLGGSLADALDRTRLLLGIQVIMACCSVGLAVNSQGPHPSLWPLYVLPALIAALSGADNPTRTAVLMNLVGRENFVSANVLRQSVQQVALVAGPALGGILLASYGPATVYWIDVASFGASIAALLRLPAFPPEGGGTRFGLRSVAEGFRFLRGRQAIQGCFAADLNATILGMPTALFPAMGLMTFHGGARAVGYLYAAPGIGALLGTVLGGWTAFVRRTGLAIVMAIVVWGVAITLFGLTTWLPVALILLAVAGGADVISAIFRNSIIQLEAPDRLRGRLSSLHTAVVQAGPRLGNTEAGAVAALSTAQVSVISGGLGCLAGIALIGYSMPKFLHYRIGPSETADHARTGTDA